MNLTIFASSVAQQSDYDASLAGVYLKQTQIVISLAVTSTHWKNFQSADLIAVASRKIVFIDAALFARWTSYSVTAFSSRALKEQQTIYAPYECKLYYMVVQQFLYY